jgi:hypothetical protein
MPLRLWSFCITLTAITFLYGCAPRAVKTVEFGDPGAAARVLIASERSDFKQAVIERVVAGFENEGLFFKIIDLRDLDGASVETYNAVVIINTCVAWQLNPRVTAFLEETNMRGKTVLLTTAGDADWHADAAGVDAITAASSSADVDRTADKLRTKIRTRIHAAS